MNVEACIQGGAVPKGQGPVAGRERTKGRCGVRPGPKPGKTKVVTELAACSLGRVHNRDLRLNTQLQNYATSGLHEGWREATVGHISRAAVRRLFLKHPLSPVHRRRG